MLQIDGSYDASSLTNAFKDVPAIICGSGPSFGRNAHIVQKLQNKALIFAGGSAVNACESHGIRPHLNAGIDPHERESLFFGYQDIFEVPTVYRNRLHHQALKVVQAPKIFLKGAVTCAWATWMEDELRIPGEEIPGGYSVTATMVQLAYLMGCNPIIFVGVDLAYLDKKEYSCPFNFLGMEIKEEEKETPEFYYQWKDETFGEGIQGNKIKTTHQWLAEAEWYNDFIRQRLGVRWVNTSEHGLNIASMENMPLGIFPFEKERDIIGMIHNAVQGLPRIKVSSPLRVIKIFEDSLRRCRDIVCKVLNEPFRAALFELDLEQEIAYEHFLKHHRKIYEHLISRTVSCYCDGDVDLENKIQVFAQLESLVDEYL